MTEEKTPEEEIADEIAVFEPVAPAVQRTLTHPETGDTKVFVQKELSFLNKIKFFRLLAGTLRLASESEQGGIGGFLQETIDSVSDTGGSNEEFITVIAQLVELAPDFLNESFVLALAVRPEDQVWFYEALETIDDETGVDIINTFVAQNGKAVQDFFSKHLQKVGATIQQVVGSQDTEQE